MTKKTPPDLASGHVTPADGNVFEDLGFPSEEAERLLRQATKPRTDVEVEALVRERYGSREIPDDELAALSLELDIPVKTLRMFAKISDPRNDHLFTREALKKALANVAKKKRPGRGAE